MTNSAGDKKCRTRLFLDGKDSRLDQIPSSAGHDVAVKVPSLRMMLYLAEAINLWFSTVIVHWVTLLVLKPYHVYMESHRNSTNHSDTN